MRSAELFAGYGGLALAVEHALGAQTAWVAEWEDAPSRVLAAHWDAPNHQDITTINWAEMEPVDIISGGSPCFPAGTLIDTERDGYQPIEDVQIGDRVRTHTGRYMPVVQCMSRHAETDAIVVKILGAPEFVTTAEHPFWVRQKTRVWDKAKRQYRRTWAEPEWVAAGDLTKDSFVGFQLDERDETVPPLGPELAYVVGRYLGDGWCRNSKRSSPMPEGQRGSRVNSRWWQMFICCDRPEADELQERIEAAGFTPARFEERTVTKFRVNNRELVSRLLEFGRYAHGKRIPAWVYRLPVEDQAAMWRGWVDSDGSTQDTGQVRVTTVSEQLAHGMARVARNVYRRAVSVHRFEVPAETVIEGRTVRQRAQYQVCLPTGNREAFVEGRWVWVPVRSVRPSGPVQVFNIGVQDDESYTAWGIAVHNCQDISAAGKRAGMTEGTRSNLWVAMREAIATIRPGLVVWENVRGAYSAGAYSELGPSPGRVGGGQGDLFSGLSDVFSGIWPASGMTRNGAAFALPMSEPPTSVSGSSYWPTVPTPSATEGERGPKDLGRAWDPANQVTLADWGAAITAGVMPTRTYPRPALHREPPLPRPSASDPTLPPSPGGNGCSVAQHQTPQSPASDPGSACHPDSSSG